MSADLKGKTAIITGASRGIGKAIARRCAGLGINLAIAARGEGPLKEAADEIAGEYNVRVLAVPTDVTKQGDLENLVNKTKDELPKSFIQEYAKMNDFHKNMIWQLIQTYAREDTEKEGDDHGSHKE